MTSLTLIGGVAYALIGMFVMGAMAVDEAHARRPQLAVVVLPAVLWPLTVGLLAGTGFYEWSKVCGDD